MEPVSYGRMRVAPPVQALWPPSRRSGMRAKSLTLDDEHEPCNTLGRSTPGTGQTARANARGQDRTHRKEACVKDQPVRSACLTECS